MRAPYSQCSLADHFCSTAAPGPAGKYEDNPVFAYGSRVTVEWTTDIPEDVKSLNFWINKDTFSILPQDVTAAVMVKNMPTSTTSLWYYIISDSIYFSNNGEYPLYFEIKDGDDKTSLGKSHYFNVTGESQSTSTSTKTSSRTSDATNSEPQSTQKLPEKTVAGIAVGATIGGLLLLGLLGFLVWKYKFRNKGISYSMAELPASNVMELPVSQEIKGSRAQTNTADYSGPLRNILTTDI
ncbi:hypothetical protein TrVFT333_011262 [Trichoderma virens FT-333]|nr:hypothetical protein TrVFT333_011262 [Trichoderma virens FT-333]